MTVEGEIADNYFNIIPGVYNSGDDGCGDCCGGIMNSYECSTAVATDGGLDGGLWWIGDEEYSEPNGNWDEGCAALRM